MLIGRYIKVAHPNHKDMLSCSYYRSWNSIPLYVTDDFDMAYGFLEKDSSCLIVVGRKMLDYFNDKLLEAALYHEVSHLYFKDNLTDWDIQKDYRADLVASRMTSINIVIEALELSRVFFKDETEDSIISARIKNLLSCNSTLEVNPVIMTSRLKIVEVDYV